MRALTFSFSYPRFVMAKFLGLFGARGYLSALGPLRLEEVQEPKLPGADWALIKTGYAGICGSDVKQVFLQGAFDNPLTALVSFPHILGHEVVGTIAKIGPQCQGLEVGERVLVYPWLSCAPRGLPLCKACEIGSFPLCENLTKGKISRGMHLGNCENIGGAFAPLLTAHQSMCVPLRNESVDFKQTVLADPFAVCLHALLKSPPRPGETVLVMGAGTLGIMLIHLITRLYPETKIIALDQVPEREPLAFEYGAHRFFSCDGEEIIEQLAEHFDCELQKPRGGWPWILSGVDRVYDTVGAGDTLELGARLIRPRGSIVLVGVSPPERFEWTLLYFKEISLLGSNSYGVEAFEGKVAHSFQIFIDLLAEKRIALDKMITHSFALNEYKKAFLRARNKRRHGSIKVVFYFGE